MPFYVDDEIPDTRIPTGGALPNPKAPTSDETAAASFRAFNPMVNLFSRPDVIGEKIHPTRTGRAVAA